MGLSEETDVCKELEDVARNDAHVSGPEPHGAFLTTYVNDAALKSIGAKKGKFLDGAIIAQDNFSKDKKLKFISVMYKVKGYNAKDGDWFWAQYKPNDYLTIVGGKMENPFMTGLAAGGLSMPRNVFKKS